MAFPLRKSLFALAVFSAVPLLIACPKKTTPEVDAAPPPAPPEEDAAPVELAPLEEEDAGIEEDADADAGKKVGVAVSTNVARLKQCCGQLRTQAKTMGPSPEAGMLQAAAAQCDVLAAQAGPKGTAPEMGVLRGVLGGRNIPAICAGF